MMRFVIQIKMISCLDGLTLFPLFFQIERIVLFMIKQQGLIAARLEELGKRRAVLEDIPLVQEIAELKEDYRAVGLDLVRLLKFVDLNANAVRKILKKFDERLGYTFTDYFVRSRSNHPFSQLKQVFKHVVSTLASMLL
jgi:SPX domain protein involved in polyphosphate accumulation